MHALAEMLVTLASSQPALGETRIAELRTRTFWPTRYRWTGKMIWSSITARKQGPLTQHNEPRLGSRHVCLPGKSAAAFGSGAVAQRIQFQRGSAVVLRESDPFDAARDGCARCYAIGADHWVVRACRGHQFCGVFTHTALARSRV